MRRALRRVGVVAAAAVLVGGAGEAVYAATSTSGPAYRLATAAPADVTATLHSVGTLTPVRRADVAFPIGGPVATVAVKAGQHVTTGQQLGSLDTTSLTAKLTAAQSGLASANATVASDIASQDAATATPAPAPSATTASRTGSGAGAGAGSGTGSASLTRLQQAVLTAQRAADSALRGARTALAQADKACGAGPSPGPSPTSAGPTPTGSGSSTPVATPTPSATTPSPSPSAGGCAAAMRQALAAQTQALSAQQALAGQLGKLSKALSSAGGVRGGGGTGGTGGSGTGGSGGSGGSGTGGSGGSGTGGTAAGKQPSGPVSAAQLAADQASADAASAEVAVARQNLDAATVVSPISGTVVAVSVTPGGQAGAGSTAFVVDGLHSYEAVAQLNVSDVPKVKVGQSASVLPDGMSSPLHGSVVSIGLAPATSGSSTTYPVTIGLNGPASGLRAGASAAVTVTTAHSTGVSVPTSAVHTFGRFATVTVDAGGTTQTTRVTVGAMGPVMTQIASGLTAGQRVVLANLHQPLPSNTLGRFGRGGGLGGGAGVRRVVRGG